jgi:predicted alpha/beta-hydrolase family hydrolase
LLEPVEALVCFGYPLVGIGKKRPVRDAVLRELTAPILFIQGTRDELCPLELLESVRREMKAPSSLHVVDGGDHSLSIRAMDERRTGMGQREVDAAILEAVRGFVEEHGPKRSSRRATSRRAPR